MFYQLISRNLFSIVRNSGIKLVYRIVVYSYMLTLLLDYNNTF